MATRADFPDEILVEIFSRLPAKPIGKFRSLSKSWRKSLSSPHFIKSHLARQKSRRQQQANLILITTMPRSFRCIETINDDDGTISRALNLPAGFRSNILVPCDGLILLIIDRNKMFLANPITLEQVEIPNPPLFCDELVMYDYFSPLYGLVYDSVNDDYKVVEVFFVSNFRRIFDIYSVKTGVRKMIKSPPVINTYPPNYPLAASFNGAIHWLAGGYKLVGEIHALDVANEVCFEIPVPSDIRASSVLRVLGGCLCIIDDQSNGEWTDVWIMKEYGMADSWTKLTVPKTVYDPCLRAPLKPLCFIRDEEEVVLVKNEQLVVHNVKEGTSRDLVVDGIARTVLDGLAFVDSLVSPTALWGHGGEQAND
ncbi:hypothetical protein CASFOL_030054 [Castilleja foliolosa]|uniref:F-box domain-containing protein n=1 Tax=Castilleja foliolosa TaxID=1961234 RepID=A0ABD3C9K0_9LAMI